MVIGVDIRFLAKGVQSGVEEYAVNLLPRLFDLGKSIKFKLFYNALKKKTIKYPWLNLSNVKLFQFSIPNRFLQVSSFFFGLPEIDKLIGGVDVFFSPHFILAPVSKKCKKVITFHDLSFEYYPEFFSFQRKIWHKLMKPKFQAKEAGKIIAVSRSTKDDLMNLYEIPSKKIEIVYPGVGEEFGVIEESKIAKIAEKYGLPDKFILYFGTIEPRKNIEGIIKAFELSKTDAKLVIAGAPGWLYNSVFSAARKSGRRKDIIFTGSVEREDKPALYNLTELFVYPSFFEGFGFPPLEAMACGAPTIVSDAASLPEVAGEAALMVNPYNISEFARAMKEVLEDGELRKKMRERGLALAKKFSWQTCAQKTLEILAGVLN